MTYSSTHEVRYGDIDRFGHVNHLRLLEFFESARNPFFAAMAAVDGEPNVLDTAGFVVARIDATFHQAVDADAREVEVRTCVERLGTSSVTMRYELWHGSLLRVSASTVLVFVGAERAEPMSALRREFLARYSTVDGEQTPDQV